GCSAQDIVSYYNPASTAGNDGGFELWVAANGIPKFAVYQNGQLSSTVPGNVVLSPNTWYHIAGVYTASPTAISIYVNGMQTGSNPSVVHQPPNNTVPFRLGRSNDNTVNNYFTGQIDEVRFSTGAVYTDLQYFFPVSIQGSWGHLTNLPDSNGVCPSC